MMEVVVGIIKNHWKGFILGVASSFVASVLFYAFSLSVTSMYYSAADFLNSVNHPKIYPGMKWKGEYQFKGVKYNETIKIKDVSLNGFTGSFESTYGQEFGVEYTFIASFYNKDYVQARFYPKNGKKTDPGVAIFKLINGVKNLQGKAISLMNLDDRTSGLEVRDYSLTLIED